jgi:hypothetical protein
MNCSFGWIELKLTRWSTPPSLMVATPMTQVRLVRPVSIHGGSITS